MPIKLCAEVAASLVESAQEPARRGTRYLSEAKLASLVKDGRYIHAVEVYDLAEDQDGRLRQTDQRQIAAAFDCEPIHTYTLGRKTKTSFYAHPYFTLAAAANYFASLEQLGFLVEPDPLVALALRLQQGLQMLNNHELTVHRFATERHKMAPFTLVVAGREQEVPRTSETIKTLRGYRHELLRGDDGQLISITIHSPKYRYRPAPVPFTCPVCGLLYAKGDPDDGVTHRQEHRKALKVLEPKPDPKLAALVADGWDGVVDAASPRMLQAIMYQRARFFRREEGYDFVQWNSEGETSPDVRGHLFITPDGVVEGAACFRRRQYKNWPEPRWTMDWIWLIPRARRQGLLTRRWPAFLAEYGAFYVEGPRSDAMKAFLAKHGDPFKAAEAESASFL